MHCCASLLPLATFKKNSRIFPETYLFLLIKKSKLLTFWEILLFQLHSTVNLLLLAIFQKNHSFFSKNTFFLFFKTNFWTFWEVLLFQLHPPTKFLTMAISTKSIFFSKNPFISFIITKFWTFWEVLLFQSYFTASLIRSVIYWKKFNNFFQKTHHTFPWKKVNSKRFLRTFINSVAFYSISAKITVLFERTVFFEKPFYFN